MSSADDLKRYDDLKSKTPAELRRLWDELVRRRRAIRELEEITGTPQQRLDHMRRKDVDRRFHEWMDTASVIELGRVHLDVVAGEFDKEEFLSARGL